MNGAQLLRAGRGPCVPQSPRPRSNAISLPGPKLAIRLRSSPALERQTRRQQPRRPPALLPSASTNNDDDRSGETSSPSSDALSLAPQLKGIWIADTARSSGRSKLLSAMGLSGLQRVTAEKLIEGVSLSVSSPSSSSSPSSPSSASASSLVANFLTVVPFFNVTEAVPLDGSSVELPRRDLKPGTATVSIAVASGGRGTTRLVVVSEWEDNPGGGGGKGGDKTKKGVVSLRETYKLVKPTELQVEASLAKGSSAVAVASSTTVYR